MFLIYKLSISQLFQFVNKNYSHLFIFILIKIKQLTDRKREHYVILREHSDRRISDKILRCAQDDKLNRLLH